MSATPLPAPFLVRSNPSIKSSPKSVYDRSDAPRPMLVRRRPDRQQGRALEVLGHALEYLVDTRTFQMRETTRKSDSEAIQILSRSSREVFATCPEVVPVWQRMRGWLAEHLLRGMPSLGDAARKA